MFELFLIYRFPLFALFPLLPIVFNGRVLSFGFQVALVRAADPIGVVSTSPDGGVRPPDGHGLGAVGVGRGPSAGWPWPWCCRSGAGSGRAVQIRGNRENRGE